MKVFLFAVLRRLLEVYMEWQSRITIDFGEYLHTSSVLTKHNSSITKLLITHIQTHSYITGHSLLLIHLLSQEQGITVGWLPQFGLQLVIKETQIQPVQTGWIILQFLLT